MKKILFLIVFWGMTSLCFADVTGKIIGKDQDENGNIIIKTAYFKDGVNVESRYPKATIKDADGKDIEVYYWVFRISAPNLADKSQAEQTTYIKDQVSQFAKNLIQQDYIKKANAELLKGQVLNDLVGQSVTETTADIQVSPTKVWTAKTDGTMTEKIIEAKTEAII